eukprot:m.73648 g.73648  ORF g.73648 m.73648 type:complete len:452 (-) comp16129_c0_seq1:202-1557(-)
MAETARLSAASVSLESPSVEKDNFKESTKTKGRQESVYTRGVTVPAKSRKRILRIRRLAVSIPDVFQLHSVSQQDAEAALSADGRDGAFFYRMSTAQSGSIVLSMCWKKEVHHFVMNFPVEPSDGDILQKYLRSFAKRQSRKTDSLLPGQLKYYLPDVVRKRDSTCNRGAARPISIITNALDIKKLSRGVSQLDLDMEDIVGEFADDNGVIEDASYADIEGEMLEEDEATEAEASACTGADGSPTNTESVLYQVHEGGGEADADPVYDDFQQSSFRPGMPEYALVQKQKGNASSGNAYDDPQDALKPTAAEGTTPGHTQLDVVPPPLLPKTSPGKLKASLDVLRQEDPSEHSEPRGSTGENSDGGDGAQGNASGASDTYMTLHPPAPSGSETSDGDGYAKVEGESEDDTSVSEETLELVDDALGKRSSLQRKTGAIKLKSKRPDEAHETET